MGNDITIAGRILYLSANADVMSRQMEGETVSLQEALPLRDEVSTDEITPAAVCLTYDQRIGQHVYVGFSASGELPIGTDAVRTGGFEVTVAGKRYGKGSSRESSPLAERAAGIRLIVAESFERIYRQNCDNLGILTTTDFSILDRLLAGEGVPIERFLADRDPLTREIVESGGLLLYTKARSRETPAVARHSDGSGGRPMSLAEKIVQRCRIDGHGEARAGDGILLSATWRFSHDYFTGLAAHIIEETFGAGTPLERPDQIIAFQDHLVFADQSFAHVQGNLLGGVADLLSAHDRFVRSYPVRSHGRVTGQPGSEGICHLIMTEKYALPGQVVVGTDSHTPHCGALGALAFGAGATDIANSWVTGRIRCRMPEIVRVELTGVLPSGVLVRDLVQYLLASDLIQSGRAVGVLFEFAGPAVTAMSIDQRTTLTNMVAEMGGFSGLMEPDARTVEYLRERRSVDFVVEEWMHSDPGAAYVETVRIDCSGLTPMVARPGDPGRSVPLGTIGERARIDIAFGGSCTAAKREDFDAYHQVLDWGLRHGLRVASGVELFLQFGTLDVSEYCRRRGYLPVFEAVGAHVLAPGCGACANGGPGQSIRADQVSISSSNRNFPGRSGPGNVWLGSPHTVAASALAGRLTSFEELRNSSRSDPVAGASEA